MKTRQTRQRQLILEVLRRANGPLTASQLYERAAVTAPSLAKSTVYRNLEQLAERGEICRGFLETGESFFSIAGGGHQHYMICRDCNRMQDLPSCPMGDAAHLTGDSGFVATDHVVQVYGYCETCALNHRETLPT